MQKIDICLFGGGNITNLRHIPALKKQKNVRISGLIGKNEAHVHQTAATLKLANHYCLSDEAPLSDQLRQLDWFGQSQAVVLGTPPQTHYALARACLEAGKHVLVEKPMAMNPPEAEELVQLAAEREVILCVMHNFQFSRGMSKLTRLLEKGELGQIVSFQQSQLTSRNRRLPVWYQDLPQGLFFDEAAHFFYLLQRFGGEIQIRHCFSHHASDATDRTPQLMSVEMLAGDIPTHLFINFNSPVCEWLFTIVGEKKLAVYDFFRDILILLPNDNQHMAGDILRTSLTATLHHWQGFIGSGLRLVSGNLHYGVDVVVAKFLQSISSGKADPAIEGLRGLETVTAMSEVADNLTRAQERP